MRLKPNSVNHHRRPPQLTLAPAMTYQVTKHNEAAANRRATTVNGGVDSKATLVAMKETAQKKQATKSASLAGVDNVPDAKKMPPTHVATLCHCFHPGTNRLLAIVPRKVTLEQGIRFLIGIIEIGQTAEDPGDVVDIVFLLVRL